MTLNKTIGVIGDPFFSARANSGYYQDRFTEQNNPVLLISEPLIKKPEAAVVYLHFNVSGNLQLWCFNMAKGELEIVPNPLNYPVRKVKAEKDLLYITAINKKNAMRKVLLAFGWRYDKKTGFGIPLFPTETIKEVIELNKPEPVATSPATELDRDPDAETDYHEPFEDDGAYAD